MDDLIGIALSLPVKGQGQARLLEPGEGRALIRAMCEPTGREPLHAYVVVVPPGKNISEHSHPEDVVLFYPEDTDTPVYVDGEPHWPQAGEILLIPKHVIHWVPVNETGRDRVSVAVKLKEPESE